MLIVVGIIALLTAMIVGVARRIDNQSKERLAENTIAIINTALGQFKDYKYDYNDINYRGFVFPLDCNGFDVTLNQPQNVLSAALGAAVAMTPEPNTTFTGCEVMYFLLSRIPECRSTLDKIDKSLITSKGTNGQPISITIGGVGGNSYPLMRVIDPWKTTLRYDYYDERPLPLTKTQFNNMLESRRTFPVVISAGPDRIFGTSDDVKNR
jgi:type II secretory pathway pseudopilin PulG